MKYVVTGGAGFIGSHLAEYLVDRGHIVTVIDNPVFGKEGEYPAVARQSSFSLCAGEHHRSRLPE